LETRGQPRRQDPTPLERLRIHGRYWGTVTALHATNGSEKWRNELGEDVRATIEAENGSVYVATDSGRLYSLDASNGSTKWSYAVTYGSLSTPKTSKGNLYLGTSTGHLYRIDPETGDKAWRRDLGGGAVPNRPLRTRRST